MPAPSGPSSHLWPSAARKSTGVCPTSSGKTPKAWMASTNSKAPRPWTISARLVQVVAPTAGVGHPTDADDAGAAVAGRGQAVHQAAAVAAGHAADLDAAAGQVQPGILVRGEFVVRQDDVVARLPGEALGDQVDAGGRVADQGDFVGPGPDQGGRPAAELLDLLRPAGMEGVAVDRGVFGPAGDGLPGRPHWSAPRPHGRNRPSAGPPASGGGIGPNRHAARSRTPSQILAFGGSATGAAIPRLEWGLVRRLIPSVATTVPARCLPLRPCA